MAIKNMKDIIDYAAKTYGVQPVFSYKVKKEIRSKSYQELQRDSQAFSRVLAHIGTEESHVAVIGPTSYEWVVSYFGTVNSNRVIVPIDALLPAADICDLLNRADVSILVYDELRADAALLSETACPKLLQRLSMQEALPGLLNTHAGSYSKKIDQNKLCAILFTSGTTGKSKGVMLNHKNLTDNAVCLDMNIPAGTVSMTVLPIHHAYCFTMDILKAIYIGMHICINDSIMHIYRNMKLFKPEFILLVPMVIESIYRKRLDSVILFPKKLVAKVAFGGNLKTIVSGGAYLDPDYIARFKEYGITIFQGYGMTECSPMISANLGWDGKDISVGKPLPNCEAKIVEKEIWVSGTSVMMGYYHMPDETAAALECGWLKTGDLGYLDEDGFIFITGRKANLISLDNEEHISPEKSENQLSKNRLVKEVIVRESEKMLQAVIFPDYNYAKKKHIKNLKNALQVTIDQYNQNKPFFNRIHTLIIRDTEFDKTPSQKIKRY